MTFGKKARLLASVLCALPLVGCQSLLAQGSDDANHLSNDKTTLQQQVQSLQSQLDENAPAVAKLQGDLPFRMMYYAKNQADQYGTYKGLEAMNAQMLANHLAYPEYEREGEVPDNDPVFTDITNLWQTAFVDAAGTKHYFQKAMFRQAIDLPIKTNQGQEQIHTDEVWLILDTKTHLPALYFKNENGKFDYYAFNKDALHGYDWKLWVKQPLEYGGDVFATVEPHI